ncbi:DUF2306 domain-containing protein [Flavobacterium psychroterrae]|uniref:DUF2306 domain-containing protein n=1 Tax=Flavobacterium psychroterrae TaxID=2133767 RepID=A0ABS5PAT5_9FLAO|nr:DUF2306 domain-containing protein [Flavobacterium psychroterrae]MBS7231422.1 DUF2306 domain-containing protein [Flavobacterium psychroterrae]
MRNEQIIQILIYFHAIFGGIALLSGLISLIVKKGNKVHKKSGKLFYYSMLLSALTALIIATLPKHESPFLFSIGIFSSYFTIMGYRSLRFKNEDLNLKTDKIISWIMIITAILMILYNPFVNQSINIVLTVLGITGLIFSARDLILFKNPVKLKHNWLKLHLGKMIGGYIAATTAFVVVNEFFPSFYGWFIPAIIGIFCIRYWIKKLNKKQSKIALG